MKRSRSILDVLAVQFCKLLQNDSFIEAINFYCNLIYSQTQNGEYVQNYELNNFLNDVWFYHRNIIEKKDMVLCQKSN